MTDHPENSSDAPVQHGQPLDERDLEEDALLYRAVIEQSAEGIWVADMDTHELVDVNPSFCDYIGYSREELIGMSVTRFIDRTPEEMQFFKRTLRENGSLPPTEGRWVTKEGERIDVRITATLVRRQDRDLVCTIGRDLTEEKRFHDKLAVTDRLASIGTLAAGIAHEINNPLTYVLTNLHFLTQELKHAIDTGETPELKEWLIPLERSKQGAERVEKIVHDLRAFYRSDNHDLRILDVRDLFDTLLGLASSELPRHGEIVKDLREVPMVNVNQAALEQALLNILVNAVQALPDEPPDEGDAAGGGEARIHLRTREREDGYVEIAIEDTGEGIRSERLDRIFDPFYTTKSVDEGTGLGLSMAHSIVESFGGALLVDSEVGRGTTMRVLLPPAGESDMNADSVTFLDE